ncbi:MAG: amidase family protein [Lautropia sp.]
MNPLPHVYRRGRSAVDCVDACIAQITEREATTHAWVRTDLDTARAAARALDEAARAGRYRGPLHGMPIGVKDLYDVAGMPTEAGSVSRAGIAAATADAPLIAALRDAGCIVLGKTKTTEYAWLDPTDAANPFAVTRTPGGSSSGSGAAVGAGMVPLALGTQTVGSVCRPAAYCGTAAFKPTTGSTSMRDVVAFAPSYDTAGFLAPTLEIAVDAWRAAVAAGCARDATPAGDAGVRAAAAAPPSLEGMRYAMPGDAYFARIDAVVAGALGKVASWLEAAGATRIDCSLDVDLDAVRSLQRTVMFHEAAQAHAALLADTAMFARLGAHWRECLSVGATIPPAKAADARGALADATASALDRIRGLDLLLVPAAASVAPSRESTGDPGLILPWTVFGNPLSVLPLDLDDAGLPTAIMLAGQPSADARHAAWSLAVEALIGRNGGGFRGPRVL